VVANDTTTGTFVRLRAGSGAGEVIYDAAPGGSGATSQGSGSFEGSVELLNVDCQVLQAIHVRAVGNWLVTFREGAAPAAATFDPGLTVGAFPESASCHS
jgi:hypothetical protein